MKRRLACIVLAALLLLGLCCTAFAEAPAATEAQLWNITDTVGLLTSDEDLTLEARAEEISAQYGVGIYLLILEDYSEYYDDPYETAYELYHQNTLGMGEDRDGVILLMSMSDRKYATFFYGPKAEYAFDAYGQELMEEEFLDDFQPVSIKMAKTQNLSLNPTKISGTCGRLMCCLKYEQEAYEDLIKTAPKVESFVDTADGRGTVIEVNLLRQSVRVRMEDHPETIGTYKNTDIYILRSGKARKNDPPIPRDFAPISSKPRPVQKKEAFFEELPEVIYPDAVAVIAPETQAAEEETGDAAEEAGKNANRRRRRGGRRTKPAGERPQEAAVPEKPHQRSSCAPMRPAESAPKRSGRLSRTSPSASLLHRSRNARKKQKRLLPTVSLSPAAADAAAEAPESRPAKARRPKLNNKLPRPAAKRAAGRGYCLEGITAAGRPVFSVAEAVGMWYDEKNKKEILLCPYCMALNRHGSAVLMNWTPHCMNISTLPPVRGSAGSSGRMKTSPSVPPSGRFRLTIPAFFTFWSILFSAARSTSRSKSRLSN